MVYVCQFQLRLPCRDNIDQIRRPNEESLKEENKKERERNEIVRITRDYMEVKENEGRSKVKARTKA